MRAPVFGAGIPETWYWTVPVFAELGFAPSGRQVVRNFWRSDICPNVDTVAKRRHRYRGVLISQHNGH